MSLTSYRAAPPRGVLCVAGFLRPCWLATGEEEVAVWSGFAWLGFVALGL